MSVRDVGWSSVISSSKYVPIQPALTALHCSQGDGCRRQHLVSLGLFDAHLALGSHCSYHAYFSNHMCSTVCYRVQGSKKG